mmetsp:Transcript_96662/g.207421  ORF Transcript_96662/g.207421 Transcript_96662/m.207421 type:complete len:468 (-) Transcript_96662:61-1464(-)
MMLHAVVIALSFISTAKGGFPDGPNQQCHDDAGPPWMDDGPVPYYAGYPNKPVLPVTGECPPPLSAACAAKGALAAHMDGPVACGGKGWFCRIFDQPGHRMPGMSGGRFPDSNFASCNQTDTAHDLDGHCHGSDVDDVYGWWVRDHWHRNYAGSLKCCCNWEATIGVVNRCDYRKHVTPDALETCRDANEEHNVDWHPDCTIEHFNNYKEPPAETCWELTSFGPGSFEDTTSPTTTAPTTSIDGGSSWTFVDGGVGRVCRGSSSIDDSSAYYTLHEGLTVLSDCKAKCEETPGCRGVEHNPKSRCEVWTRSEGIQASRAVPGYTCLRYGTSLPTTGPVQSFVPIDGGQDRACRGANMGDNSASYYTVHGDVDDLDDCEAKCIATAECQGIEYNEDLGRCEVWIRSEGILASAPVSGFSCFRYGRSTGPLVLEEMPRRAPRSRRHSFLGTALLQRTTSLNRGPLDQDL